MNCVDNCCWHLRDMGELKPFEERFYCTKNNIIISDPFKEFECPEYAEVQSCSTCDNASMEVWESGTIDCIAYRCKCMDSNISYLNNSPLNNDFADHPKCPINAWAKG